MPTDPSTWRRSARTSLTRAAAVSGVLSRFERRMAEGWTILTYHRVLEDPAAYPFESLVTPVDVFRSHIQRLADRCRVLPVAESLRLHTAGVRDGRPLVSITFDDGYVDSATIAATILERAGLRATFFVTTGPVGGYDRLWFDRAARRFLAATPEQAAAALRECDPVPRPAPQSLREWMARLKALPPLQRDRAIASLRRTGDERATEHDRLMRPDELAALAGRGHEVAAHTITHPMLPVLDDDALERELRIPREQIAQWTGDVPAGFCYPNGDHDDRAAAAVARAGYAYACTTLPGRNTDDTDPLRLRRIDMNPGRMRRRDGHHDTLAFRAEVCLLHRAWS